MSSRVQNPDATLFEAQTRKMTTHTRENKCLATISHTMAALQAQFRLVIQISESAVRRVLQFSSLPEKTRKSNRLQMSLQKQQFLWSR